MYCYDDNGQFLSVISCIPHEGEEHYWEGYGVYECTGEFTKGLGCRNGMIFRKVDS